MGKISIKHTNKRQSLSIRLPLNHALVKNSPSKKRRVLSIWLGSKKRLQIVVVAKPKPKRLTKKQQLVRQQRHKFQSIILITLALIGIMYFGFMMLRPLPPPSIATPIAVYQESVMPIKQEAMYFLHSEPTRLHIEDASIDTDVLSVGKNNDNSLEVPNSFDQAGWYRLGPSPGERGPAVIVGHVNSKYGPAVFWNLGKMHQGQIITVERADGTKVTFAVTGVKEFSQDNFPTSEVYGDIDYAGLRLITCGGRFDRLTRSYTHNTVVFAAMVM